MNNTKIMSNTAQNQSKDQRNHIFIEVKGGVTKRGGKEEITIIIRRGGRGKRAELIMGEGFKMQPRLEI